MSGAAQEPMTPGAPDGKTFYVYAAMTSEAMLKLRPVLASYDVGRPLRLADARDVGKFVTDTRPSS